MKLKYADGTEALIGDIVKRGPDWGWGSQDCGSEGHCNGMIVGDDGDGWAIVRWLHGDTNRYRLGDGHCYDLTLVRHTCEKEEESTEIIGKYSDGTPAYPGDIVRRGPDWEWGQQDHGESGPGFGVLVESADGFNAGWYWVRWDNGSESRAYRLGFMDYYDLALVRRGDFDELEEPEKLEPIGAYSDGTPVKVGDTVKGNGYVGGTVVKTDDYGRIIVDWPGVGTHPGSFDPNDLALEEPSPDALPEEEPKDATGGFGFYENRQAILFGDVVNSETGMVGGTVVDDDRDGYIHVFWPGLGGLFRTLERPKTLSLVNRRVFPEGIEVESKIDEAYVGGVPIYYDEDLYFGIKFPGIAEIEYRRLKDLRFCETVCEEDDSYFSLDPTEMDEEDDAVDCRRCHEVLGEGSGGCPAPYDVRITDNCPSCRQLLVIEALKKLGCDDVYGLLDSPEESVETAGLKFDAEKPEFSLLPVFPLRAVADVLTYGKVKYDAHNWRKGLDWSRVMDAIERHYSQFKAGQDTDSESGLHHLAHLMANVMFLLEYTQTHPELDDRYKDGASYDGGRN